MPSLFGYPQYWRCAAPSEAVSVPRSAFSPQYTIVVDQLSPSPFVVVRFRPHPLWRSGSSPLPYGFGKPFPWPK